MLIFSPPVVTLNRKVRVSCFGAALRWESKQFCLYSSNADDEWTDGTNRRSVKSTLSYCRILHHTHFDKKVGEGDAQGFVPCTTFTWLRVYVSVSGTTAGLVSGLRTKTRQRCLQFYFSIPFCGDFFLFWARPPKRAALYTTVSCQPFQQVSPAVEVWYPAVLAPRGWKAPSQPAAGNWGSNYYETSTVTAEIFEQSTSWVRWCSVILLSTNSIKSNNKLMLSVYPKPDIACSPAPKDLHCAPADWGVKEIVFHISLLISKIQNLMCKYVGR